MSRTKNRLKNHLNKKSN